jgi:hypothetical protein
MSVNSRYGTCRKTITQGHQKKKRSTVVAIYAANNVSQSAREANDIGY